MESGVGSGGLNLRVPVRASLRWMSTALLLCLFVLSPQYSGASTMPLTAGDSLAVVLRELERKLPPLASALDSLETELRTDSATARADTMLVLARRRLSVLVRDVISRAIDSPALQIAAYPGGSFDYRRRRAERPVPADSAGALAAKADSIVLFLDARGVWTGRGEGSAYFSLSDGALVRRFGRFISPVAREHLEITSTEQRQPSFDDASLMITWDQLGDRLARTDRFLSENWTAAGSREIASYFDFYLSRYLRGSENTKAFDYRSRRMPPEVRRSYQRYVTEYGSSASGSIIRRYLAVLRANGWRDTAAVRRFAAQYDRFDPRVR